MEALLILLVLGIVVVVPLLAIAAFVRVVGLQRRVDELRAEVGTLEARVGALGKRGSARGAEAPGDAEAAVALVAPEARRASTEPRPEPVVPAPPTPPPARPVAPAPPAARAAPATTPIAPPGLPAPPAATAMPPATPPRLPAPPPEPPPSSPAFDWESLLGIKGAAWVGGIAFAIAGILFAKFAIDRNLITPELRIALMIFAGVFALAGAELSLRRGYATTANAVSGAGIAILYAAFFSAHALYQLFPLALTFALMALVTVLACALAIRYDAFFTAVLGLLGGFATPVALSTGEDRPIGLFSYILLLNAGLLAVALRKRWHGLVLLSLAGTFVIEMGWFSRYLAPQKMPIGLGAFLLFGFLYLLLPAIARRRPEEVPEPVMQAGVLGGIVPLFFAIMIASDRQYAGEWPLLFAYVGLLEAALMAVALLRGQVALLVSGSLATALTLPLWAAQGLSRENLWGATLGAVVLAALPNLAPRLGRWLRSAAVDPRRAAFESAGLAAAAGLGFFVLVLVDRDLGEPPWPFLVLLVGLSAFLLERSAERGLVGVAPAGALALAALIQLWFFASTPENALLRNLSVPLLFAIALAFAAARPSASAGRRAAVVLATLVTILGLFGCLVTRERGADPWPLFLALAVAEALLALCALREGASPLVPLGLVAAAAFTSAWHFSYFHPGDVFVVLPIYAAFYSVFLALPFVVPRSLAPRWERDPWPWLASALAGPLFFPALYDAVARAWGKAYIGALPVLLAALSVAALKGVAGRFEAREAAGERRRLNYLALFATIALGFVALAVPLQVDRQWITVAWALEAAAVFWLFGRLPHPGLRIFGAALFAGVGIRLLVNAEVLRYEPRGLPLVNWLLYTYGVPALACLVGAALLRASESGERARAAGVATTRVPAAVSLLGLVLIFALINLEIADYFSPGRYLELWGERGYARDLTTSLAWGVYAMALLVVGVWRRVAALRYVSLGFLILTVAKVFLYDLSNLVGLYRVLSFLGLGVALILVSLFYQRFVFRRERAT